MMGGMAAFESSAPSMAADALPSAVGASAIARIERWLDGQRDQIALWNPVALGSGIAAWFVLPERAQWQAFLALMAAIALAGLVLPIAGRSRRIVIAGALLAMIGCGAVWTRALWVAAPVLTRPIVTTFDAHVENVEIQAAKARSRLTLTPIARADLPPRVRVTVDDDKMVPGLAAHERVRVRARLVGPPSAAIPGGFDFSRIAWFQGLGAIGKALDPIVRIDPARSTSGGIRARLSAHIRSRLDGSAGGIAAAFASGDRGGIAPEDEEAMRASGLTHLLSVSGLHVTAVVAAAMYLTLKLLALSKTLAIRAPLLLISALAGAAAGIGYTLLTGAEVPTVRSCIAAVLVLIGIAMGREAITLRLVATGAVVVLLLWPEALVGPSFQLSFAAITAIVALHENRRVQVLTSAPDAGLAERLGRGILGLLLTGLVVEAALAPIALFHFHKSGLYGALANIIAIPLTTFVIMPLEALALLFDIAGLGAPFWWLTGHALDLLLWLARTVAAVPGAQAALASVPQGAFGLIVGGGLWLMLWRGRVRLAGALPIMIGALWALLTPAPDLLITGDGLHMAIRSNDGTLATLRPRAGDYVRSALSERAGVLGELDDLDMLPEADCATDSCRVTLNRGDRTWRVFAIRSRYLLPAPSLRAECASADIVVSDRRLPDWCQPRWFRADRALLARSGGLAITLSTSRVETVADTAGAHPWVLARNAGVMARPEYRPALRP